MIGRYKLGVKEDRYCNSVCVSILYAFVVVCIILGVAGLFCALLGEEHVNDLLAGGGLLGSLVFSGTQKAWEAQSDASERSAASAIYTQHSTG